MATRAVTAIASQARAQTGSPQHEHGGGKGHQSQDAATGMRQADSQAPQKITVAHGWTRSQNGLGRFADAMPAAAPLSEGATTVDEGHGRVRREVEWTGVEAEEVEDPDKVATGRDDDAAAVTARLLGLAQVNA
jgi:hypothetical protein